MPFMRTKGLRYPRIRCNKGMVVFQHQNKNYDEEELEEMIQLIISLKTLVKEQHYEELQ